MAEQEDMGLALQNHQLEADNERLTGQNAALREINHQLDERCVELYRQLTQTRADAEHFAELGQASDMQASVIQQENAAMRALLSELVSDELYGYGAESSIRYCSVCNGNDDGNEYAPIEHAPDCSWLKARAFLAEHPSS